MNSVLIIDDDKELCALMKKCVEQENLSAVVAHGGLEGLRLLEENKDACSLIILDVMMPDMDGFQVLQKIREKNNVPVLMLTAKSDEEDKVSGLRLGADDYLTKPFSINELMARIHSLVRRYTTLNPIAGNVAATMLLKDMVIDRCLPAFSRHVRPPPSIRSPECEWRGTDAPFHIRPDSGTRSRRARPHKQALGQLTLLQWDGSILPPVQTAGSSRSTDW